MLPLLSTMALTWTIPAASSQVSLLLPWVQGEPVKARPDHITLVCLSISLQHKQNPYPSLPGPCILGLPSPSILCHSHLCSLCFSHQGLLAVCWTCLAFSLLKGLLFSLPEMPFPLDNQYHSLLACTFLCLRGLPLLPWINRKLLSQQLLVLLPYVVSSYQLLPLNILYIYHLFSLLECKLLDGRPLLPFSLYDIPVPKITVFGTLQVFNTYLVHGLHEWVNG